MDCEHGDVSDSAMHTTVHAVAAAGCSPIVRVAAPENYLIKRALDTGAHGIMVPMCNNAVCEAGAVTVVSLLTLVIAGRS